MNEKEVADKFFLEKTLDEKAYQRILTKIASPLFSIYQELSILLYLGVIFLSTGIGMLVYINRYSLGHTLIISVISIFCISCGFYCFRKKEPYSPFITLDKGMVFNSTLVLGCLSMASLLGYIHYQFSVFGEHHEMVFFILALTFLPLAYQFDSISVLSLGITSLASTVGIVITPTELLRRNDFSSERLIYSALALGLLISLVGYMLDVKKIKQHFTFTYIHFSLHLLFIAALSGLFTQPWWLIYFIFIVGLVYAALKISRHQKSFYFLLCSIFYGYIAAGYFVVKLLSYSGSLELLFAQFLFFYFIGSSILTIRFLINQRKIFSQL